LVGGVIRESFFDAYQRGVGRHSTIDEPSDHVERDGD